MFRDIIGRKDLIEKIISAVQAGRIPHAQLLWGPAGDQKLPLALAYAQYINCSHKLYAADGHDLNGLSSDACGKCPSCIKFQKLVHPDLHFIYPNNSNGKAAANTSQSLDYIEQWRNLYLSTGGEFSYNEWTDAMGIGNRQAIINVRDCQQIMQCLSLKSSEAAYRVVVIWMIEKLRQIHASILLKTLEEPEPQTVFIVISEDIGQVLTTILSRMQLSKVRRIDDDAMKSYLLDKTGGDQSAAEAVTAQSSGNLLLARQLIENNDLRQNFHQCFADWMRICFRADVAAIYDFSERMSDLGRENLKFFFELCLEEIQGSLLTHNRCTGWIKGGEEQKRFWSNFSDYVSNQNVHKYYQLFNKAIFLINRNIYTQSLIMDTSLDLCRILTETKKKLQNAAYRQA